MKRLLILGCFLLGAVLAQQQATLSGIIKTDDEMHEATRVAIHIVDRDNVWRSEIATVSPVAGTFSITLSEMPTTELSPLRSGAILLPGLQNEYTVTPAEGVNYAQARINMYVDMNGTGTFDRVTDAFYIGLASLENPTGFFSLIYVDQPVTISGRGVDLNFAAGWNIFTVRFPNDGDPVYSVQASVEDAVMDVFLP